MAINSGDQQVINLLCEEMFAHITDDVRARRIARGEPIDDLGCKSDKPRRPNLMLVWSRD